MSKNRSPPILIIAGIDTMKVLKTIFKLLALFINLNTLTILKDLTIVADPPRVKLVLAEMIELTIDSTTMTKSKIFQESLK